MSVKYEIKSGDVLWYQNSLKSDHKCRHSIRNVVCELLLEIHIFLYKSLAQMFDLETNLTKSPNDTSELSEIVEKLSNIL